MKWYITYFLMLTGVVWAQKDKHLPRGNDAFEDKEYASAEAEYRISHSKYGKSESAYNLGNSIYRQGQVAESKNSFLKAVREAKTYEQKHRAYHNLGNAYMQTKDYQAAVEAYKNALRANPNDEETRYNYALAKKFLKDNPPPESKGDDKKKDPKDQKDKNKDQNQDQKDKDKQKEKQDQQKNQNQNQNQDQKNQQNKPDQNQNQPKPQPQGGIPKDRLQNMLDAVNNEEKKIQDKMNAKKVKVRPVETEKDW